MTTSHVSGLTLTRDLATGEYGILRLTGGYTPLDRDSAGALYYPVGPYYELPEGEDGRLGHPTNEEAVLMRCAEVLAGLTQKPPPRHTTADY